ncbi:MAG TPA: permease prefix domain 2-containing transporter [Chitinophagaceae bacterium]|nr:permease prefix domain 2-containing transporter [Chitinophagaceae bacterium]
MKSKENNQPPRLPLTFFRWYCHPDLREEIEGDLLERFHKHSTSYSEKKARWLFIKEVLLLLRPRIIRGMLNQSQLKFFNMSKINWIKLTALNLACVLMIISPFIPGPPNKLVKIFSMMGNIAGLTAVLLVPVGLMWTITEVKKWKQEGKQIKNKTSLYQLAIGTSVFMASFFLAGIFIFPSGMKIFALTGLLLVIFGLVAGKQTINKWKEVNDTFMNRAPSFIFAILTTAIISIFFIIGTLGLFEAEGIVAGIFGLLVFSAGIIWALRQIRNIREKVERKFNRLPVYLLSIPLTAFLVAMFVTTPVSDFSRTYAIKQGQLLINAIENYYREKGDYPESIEYLANAPKHTSIMGAGGFLYEKNQNGYNLSFIQWLHFGATEEIVMYNKNDEHNVKGHFATYNARKPHWKYYWLD